MVHYLFATVVTKVGKMKLNVICVSCISKPVDVFMHYSALVCILICIFTKLVMN